jgi:hypothetical protein
MLLSTDNSDSAVIYGSHAVVLQRLLSVVQWVLVTLSQGCFIMSASAIQGEKCPRPMSLRDHIQGYLVPILVDPGHSCNVIAVTIANKLCDSSILFPYLLLYMATRIILGLVLQGILPSSPGTSVL